MAGSTHDRERGAALVEMALIVTLLMMVLVGTVTAGMAYGRSNALQTAAREGARFGATLPDAESATDAWLQDVRDVAKAAAIGDLDDGVPGEYICVAFVHPDGTTRRLVETTADAYADAACFSDGRPDEEKRVQVEVRRTSEIQAILFSTDVTLTGTAVARYER